MALLRKLWPSSLFGQLMLVVAVAILLVQSVNAIFRYQAIMDRMVADAASYATARAVNTLDQQDRPELSYDWRRPQTVILRSEEAIQPDGFRNAEELTTHMSSHLKSIYPDIKSVRLSTGPYANLPTELRAQNDRIGAAFVFPRKRRRYSDQAVLLVLQTYNGDWVHTVVRIRGRPTQPLMGLLFETLLIYLAVILPLALVTRRMTRPLRQLTQKTRSMGLTTSPVPLTPNGPSDLQNLIVAFNEAEKRLASMLTEKDVMLGAIGHDLKTPLASLRVRIESVEDEVERQKMAATVEEMVAMLDDILMLARVGKQSDPLQKTDLVALAEAVCEDFPADAKIELKLPDQRITLEVRPILLKRAIRNLVSNALLYGGSATVLLEQSAPGVAIIVDDNGPGIPEEKMKELLEPFARAEGSRNRGTGGSGLGLTIARAISEAHGGSIQLENRVEGGLRARLLIGEAKR